MSLTAGSAIMAVSVVGLTVNRRDSAANSPYSHHAYTVMQTR